jgi:glycosyltransferase involved in cell wall biosynthesis
MKVLVSARRSSARAVHGGPIIARRQAQALSRLGAEVVLMAPEPPEEPAIGPVRVLGYAGSSGQPAYLAMLRPDGTALAALEETLAREQPDVLYDVSGPAWPIDGAARLGIPVVSMVGDYNWYCARSFRVDSSLRRCSGPDSVDKCFACETRRHPLKRRVLQQGIRRIERLAGGTLAHIGRIAPYRVWHDLHDARAYLDRLRQVVRCFVVGDREARRFFESHGVASERIAWLPQALPADALLARRVDDEPAEFSARRPLRIGFVGRLDEEKGFPVLARAFESLAESLPVELWVVHRDDATPEKVRTAFADAARLERSFASGRVRLSRPEASGEVYGIMARMDVGVVPSIAYESPSLALLEFAAQGTPVVRSESDGMSHVIQDGVNGRTFPYGNSAALATVLAELSRDAAIVASYRRRLPLIADDSAYAAALLDILRAAAVGRESVHG